MVLVMKRARTFMIVFIVETIGVLMFLGCSSPKNKKTSDAPMDTAIDFETANQQRTSVCSVGIVIVRDGEIADSYYSLIKPEPE